VTKGITSLNKNKACRFLVIRTDRMGDVILSTPVISAIKNAFPTAHTTMMVRQYTKDIVKGHPDLDCIIVDEPENEHKGFYGFFRLTKILKAKNFDTVLLLHPSLRLALLCYFAGIRTRVGTAFRAYSFLFNKRVKSHRKKSGKHECDLNLELAAAVGANTDKVDFKTHIPEQAEKSVMKKAHQLGLDLTKPFMVIHAGSGGSALDWPLDKFGQLANRAAKDLKLQVVLTGTTSEKKQIDSVAMFAKINLIRLEGQLDIKELSYLLKKSSIVVANSTGPLHLADAVGAKVVGLYCPLQACRPQRWGPYSQLDSVVLPSIQGCQSCKTCSYRNCMELISVERVKKMVKLRLNE
jgi:heptosyltransferase III